MLSLRQRQRLDLVKNTKKKGYYIFQQPLEGKSGPIVSIKGEKFKMLSSYDYLGLIGHADIEKAAIDAITKYGTGAGGVRLLTGTNELHLKLEKMLANFKGTDAALTFSSGYAANLAILSALLGTKDLALVDSKIHQSTIDACKLSGLPFRRFEHNNYNSLEGHLKRYSKKQRVLIISEGVFSMDGDICDLNRLIELKKKYDAFLMIDEAHSLGVMGEQGRGIDSHYNIDPKEIDIFTGSLSKAIPANGGFVAGSKDLMTLLQHASSPYIFSAALGPASVASVIESLKIIKADGQRRNTLWENTTYFHDKMKKIGYNIGNSSTPIVPILIGNDEDTLKLARKLYDKNILATPVVYPAVAQGEGRLRLCVTAAQTRTFLYEVIEVFSILKK